MPALVPGASGPPAAVVALRVVVAARVATRVATRSTGAAVDGSLRSGP